MNNIEDKSVKFCTGCGACTVICPVGAIEYKLNENGFFQAFVNKEKCINCGKCKKVCYKFLDVEKSGKQIESAKLFSAQSNDLNLIKSCTSGGIAYEISKYGINHGYKILGTIYEKYSMQAKMIIAKTMTALEQLKGSKYLQSNSYEALKEIIKECKEDKLNKFIVFGTPCQLFGITKLLDVEKIENEIIKIDLLCHGVPSYLIWNKFCDELKNEYGIYSFKDFEFRSKKYGWHSFVMKIINSINTEYYIKEHENNFYKIFFDNMTLNNSCYDCVVRKKQSLADIRLGDFWGKKYYNNQDGISAVLVLTDKGRDILNKLDVNIIEECNIEECLRYQSTQNYKNINLNNKVMKNINNYTSLKELIKDYRKSFNLKKQIKLKIKDNFSNFSPKLKYNAKKIYYSIKNINKK